MASKHRKRLEKYPVSMLQLAENIGNLRYDSLWLLFGALSRKFGRDSKNDSKAGRKQLATWLSVVSDRMNSAQYDMGTIWEICKTKEKHG